MTEYTSLEVSKRLAGAGFDAVPNALWDATGGENDEPIIVSFPRWKDDKNLCRAYRSDTLLAWLMKKDAGKVAESMGLRTLCENGRYGYVQIDVLDSGEWNVSLFRPIEVRVTAPTLPDALAEVILKVLEVSK